MSDGERQREMPLLWRAWSFLSLLAGVFRNGAGRLFFKGFLQIANKKKKRIFENNIRSPFPFHHSGSATAAAAAACASSSAFVALRSQHEPSPGDPAGLQPGAEEEE